MISVFIENLEFETIIGLLDFERIEKQKITVQAEFRAKEFVDYAKTCEFIQAKFDKKKFGTVESALEYFKTKFKKKFPTLEYFYMKISKVDIIPNAIVGAKIQKFY
ncbi:dihydroneopterin aldolase [Campylobacter iguaniorum]|uniref:Dihydroneopterin aldolase n=1 Tax=Campylobacter iguaniorum TaxID=1244531 RepID=A0A076F7V4_9BACT|nr:dihydroneopterin aldolase [Campylobacter iguaniorum]AII14126.1 dihydroneopterin aldolase [Campylobacter iguaniorum]